MSEEIYMREAIQLSHDKMESGAGGPFGAVIVKGNTIVGRGWNSVTSTSDPTAHAEVLAIRDACKRLGTFELKGCEIYSSCEPCPMCLGAIYWARLERLHFAASREDAADAGFSDAEIYKQIPLPPESRSIPSVQIMRLDAQRVFEAWLKKDDRIQY